MTNVRGWDDVVTASDEAYSLIKSAILNGSFKAGNRLKENDMAAYTGLSRTPIREALQRLHNEGWVSSTSNKSAFVRSFDRKDIADAYAVRMQLETFAVEQAATRITEHQLSNLCTLNDEMEIALSQNTVQIDTLEMINEKFHRTIIHAADNQRLELCLVSIIESPIVFRIYSTYDKTQLLRALNHHREITSALQLSDGKWASAIMAAHLSAARNSIQPDKPVDLSWSSK
jgi:DNA-binding GntR family transcriptional regulator